MAITLWRFQFSTSQTYCIEVGAEYFRFYTQGGQVLDGGSPYEVTHPYASADVSSLQAKQINDVIYITHPDYPVGKLVRLAATNWVYSVVEFDVPAMLDENLSDTTITASDTTGTITLAASASIFDALHVGSYWRIGYKRQYGFIEALITSAFDTWDDVIVGPFTVRTYGTWTADIVLQRETQVAGVWEDIHRWRARDDRNIDAETTAEEPARYRISIQNWVSATDARVVLEWGEAVIYGTVQITAVGSGTTADAVVVEDLYEARDTLIQYIASPYWAEGAWSDYRGYPRAVCTHEQRLVFGGTAFQPSTVWGSVTGDFENFLYGSAADDAYVFQLAAEELNAIQWMESADVLVIGTSGGEWRGRGDDLGGPITPSKRDFKQKTFFGSEYQRAVKVGDSTILFVERKGRKIRELHINGDIFETADLTLLSEHVTEGGVVGMAWQSDKRILWAVMGNGELWAITYDRDQEVAGWHGPYTSDNAAYKAVATIYGAGTAQDQVWVVVERVIGTTTLQTVEYFDPTEWTDIEDAFFVDSGLTYDGSAASTFSGLEHLAGEIIVGLADGVQFSALVDVDGSFELPSGFAPASVVHAGLTYVSEMRPFRIDTDPRAGPYLGQQRRIDGLKLRVLNTAGGEYRPPDEATYRDLEYLSPRLGTGTLKSGDIPVGYKSGHEYDPAIIIRQSDPLPMTLLAMIVTAEVSSD